MMTYGCEPFNDREMQVSLLGAVGLERGYYVYGVAMYIILTPGSRCSRH